MNAPVPVFIPRLNPNELEASLVSLAVQNGQAVRAGDLLASLETTKSAGDVLAEADGYVIGLRAAAGQQLNAGDVLCYLADAPDAPIPGAALPPGAPAGAAEDAFTVPVGLRITRPALEFARLAGIDLAVLPENGLVTEAVLRTWLEQNRPHPAPAVNVPAAGQAESLIPRSYRSLPADPQGPRRVVIYGGGGHGKAVIELLQRLPDFQLAGVVDDGLPPGSRVLDQLVLGGADALAGVFSAGTLLAVNAVGGIGSLPVRLKVFERLVQAGFAFPPVVHPAAVVENSAVLGDAVQVFAHAYIGSSAQIGFGAIINTGAIVSHDCQVGAYANLSPGAILAGGVVVGPRALVGMGVTVNLEVRIGAGARIGNGATVKAHVPEGGVVRAGAVWPER